ncbi:MAG: c-type cytochrome biogenesis protein CcmI, partial [Gammaproteobacteria bacterium]|nr:c-type cytochrome biogenesis protein CcmI [Gammaproteobacteria bacterium]NNJ83890.1 c-type cytochrome biogenesis protein CcmI [Gammaproteobacteria bacterium]
PILGRGQKASHDRRQLNADIYRERLSELEQQHRDGLINDRDLADARAELQRAALSDLTQADPAQEKITGHDTPPTSAKASVFGKKTLALLITLAVPVVSFGLYFQWGNPDLVTGAATPVPLAQHSGAESPGASADMPPMEDMVARLAARLREAPDNPEGWFMLGRSYTVMGRIEEAGAAFAEAYKRQPDSPEILVSYAESLAEINEGDMAGQPADLIQSALDIDPDFPSALWLAGVVAYQQNHYTNAIKYWERLQKGGKLSEQEQQMLTEVLSEARQAAKTKGDEVRTQ